MPAGGYKRRRLLCSSVQTKVLERTGREMATGTFISSNLTSLRQTFELMDRDGSGKITKDKINCVLHSLGFHPNPDETMEIIGVVDAKHTGDIDFEEFTSYVARHTLSRTISQENRQLKTVFSIFDKDGDGYVSATELRQLCRELGREITEEQAQAMIAEADQDDNGSLTYDDFRKLMHEDDTTDSI